MSEEEIKENIMIANGATEEQIKKADFGKAKREAAKKVEMDLLIDPPTEYRKRFPKGGVTKENKIKLNNLPNNK